MKHVCSICWSSNAKIICIYLQFSWKDKIDFFLIVKNSWRPSITKLCLYMSLFPKLLKFHLNHWSINQNYDAMISAQVIIIKLTSTPFWPIIYWLCSINPGVIACIWVKLHSICNTLILLSKYPSTFVFLKWGVRVHLY